MNLIRRGKITISCVLVPALLLCANPLACAQDGKAPVKIGLDAEFGVKNSNSAQSIERGIRIAIEEINQSGGVLGGRQLVLETSDNRAMPARAVKNFREFAKQEDLVAVFGGRFSPALVDVSPVAEEIGLILLDPWAAADHVVNNQPGSFVFRLSLNDSMAMQVMLAHARARRLAPIGLLVPRTAWGRSSREAAERELAKYKDARSVGTLWYNWGDSSLLQAYKTLTEQDARAIILVANEREGAILVREVAELPPEDQVPLISHWGVTGGAMMDLTAGAVSRMDFSLVQTFSFFRADPEMVERVLAIGRELFGLERAEQIKAPVGLGHAYDLTHILARAIELAGTADRKAVRSALEQVKDYRGLVKYFERPFAPQRHEALAPQDLFMARYNEAGEIVPIPSEAGKVSVSPATTH